MGSEKRIGGWLHGIVMRHKNRSISYTQITPGCHWTTNQAVTWGGWTLAVMWLGSNVATGVVGLCLWSEKNNLPKRLVGSEGEAAMSKWAWWPFLNTIKAWIEPRYSGRSMKWIHGKVRRKKRMNEAIPLFPSVVFSILICTVKIQL